MRSPRVARLILAVLLLAMAAGQFADLAGFVDVLGGYPLGPTALTWLMAVGLIGGEVAGGVLLLRRSTSARAAGATVALAVAIAWSALALSAFTLGRTLDNCGCFGVYLAQPLRWWVLAQDVYFVALAVLVWRGTRRQAVPNPGGSIDVPAPTA